MKVLVTGAAGSIGRALGRGLPELGHELRGLDLVQDAVAGYDFGWIAGDCLDPQIAARAVDGVDAVVHLAGNPGEDNLPRSLESHVLTTARLLDAMVEHGVSRIACASSNHAVGRTPRSELLTTSIRPRPDTYYGVAKVAAEALLSLYVDRHDISAVALRIGSFTSEVRTQRELSTWLSTGDAVRLVDAAITYPGGGLEVVYGISANTRAWWDLEPGRAIGYEPRDDAEQFAAQVESRPEDDAEAAFVGGPHVTEIDASSAF
jgi:uronate dehydrogenase